MKSIFKFAMIACTCTLGLSGLSSNAFAASGALDFLDPCSKARSSFNEQEIKVRAQLDAAAAQVRSGAPKEYRALWIEAVKKEARPKFDQAVAPLLREHGVVTQQALDAAFQKWFAQQL